MKYEFEGHELLAEIEKRSDILNIEKSKTHMLADLILMWVWDRRIEEPEKLKIEVGKCYKTSDNAKLVCVFIDKNETSLPFLFVTMEKYPSHLWLNKDGKCIFEDKRNDFWIVSEWTEEDEKEWRKKNESL